VCDACYLHRTRRGIDPCIGGGREPFHRRFDVMVVEEEGAGKGACVEGMEELLREGGRALGGCVGVGGCVCGLACGGGRGRRERVVESVHEQVEAFSLVCLHR
jgi:hypothetical protein